MEKKIPERMCIVCKKMADKRSLLRIVKNSDGEILPDPTGKASGRGAYVCFEPECALKLKKTKALSRAFKENVPEDAYDRVLAELKANDRE